MRKTVMILVVCWATLQLSSCKKETTPTDSTRDYSKLNTNSQSIHLPQVSQAQLLHLLDTAAAERNLFLLRLDQDHPGLKAKMDSDAVVIAQTQDSATRAQLLNNFDKSYYAIVSNTWNNCGINTNVLQGKYAAILGNVPFNMGEFGTITFLAGGGADNYGSNPPVYPDDSLHNFNGCPEHSESIIGGLPSNYSNDLNHTSLYYYISWGDFEITFNSGASINLPPQVYKYISGTFTCDGLLNCTALACMGASCSSASLSVIMEADGIQLTARDIYSLHAVAPIIWYSESWQIIHDPINITISAHNDGGLPAGTYKTYLKITNTAAGGPIAGQAQTSTYLNHAASIRMTR
jgi:hypothetical protein